MRVMGTSQKGEAIQNTQKASNLAKQTGEAMGGGDGGGGWNQSFIENKLTSALLPLIKLIYDKEDQNYLVNG